MTTSRLCPHCGYNLEAEERVVLGPFAFDPGGIASWDGRRVPLTPGEHAVLAGIVHAGGRPVRSFILADRADYDGDHNVVQVRISRIRSKFEAAGASRRTVETVRGRGYRLAVELLA